MSWSLKITHGDLDVQEARFSVVTGAEKLVQDFRAAILEEMGTDDMHPSFGSLLDGGITPSGEYVPSLIGAADPRLAAFGIEQELRRIARDIQARQMTRIQRDRRIYNKPTLTPSEILVGISAITFTQVDDTLLVNVALTTGSQQRVDVSLPFYSPIPLLST